jgi:hypothetical protein
MRCIDLADFSAPRNFSERENPRVLSPSARIIRREYALLLNFVIVFSSLD